MIVRLRRQLTTPVMHVCSNAADTDEGFLIVEDTTVALANVGVMSCECEAGRGMAGPALKHTRPSQGQAATLPQAALSYPNQPVSHWPPLPLRSCLHATLRVCHGGKGYHCCMHVVLVANLFRQVMVFAFWVGRLAWGMKSTC